MPGTIPFGLVVAVRRECDAVQYNLQADWGELIESEA
jgi:hypothetical protein